MRIVKRCLLTIAALLLIATGAGAAGTVTVVTQLNGQADPTAGTVVPQVADGLCTLTVTPAAGHYLPPENITAVRIVDAGQAQARRRAPSLQTEPIAVTPVDQSANPAGTTTYTLQMPEGDYDVEVTANFLAYELYGLTVAGIEVTEQNCQDVLGDGTVSYGDGILHLDKALLVLAEGEQAVIDSRLPALTIRLTGESTIRGALGLNVDNGTITLEKESSSDADAGLRIYAQQAVDGQVSYSDGMELQTLSETADYTEFLIAVKINTEGMTEEQVEQLEQQQNKYRIWVGQTQMTEANHLDVLGDGATREPSVLFDDALDVLVLRNAALTDSIISIRDEGLNVFLVGENTITLSEATAAFISKVSDGTLTFTCDENRPGRLIMRTTAPSLFNGFGQVLCEKGLVQTVDTETGAIVIGTLAIQPIVDEVKEMTEKQFMTSPGDGQPTEINLTNTEIENVLYTLNVDGEGKSIDGFDPATEDDEPGILLFTKMDGGAMQQVALDVISKAPENDDKKPGTSNFADSFTGFTFMVPAGEGIIILDSKIIDNGGQQSQLTVKIGTQDPLTFSHPERAKDTINYRCEEPTYVYVYNSTPVNVAPARRAVYGPFRIGDKKSTTHVKVYNINVKVGAMVSSSSLVSSASLTSSSSPSLIVPKVSLMMWSNSYFCLNSAGLVEGIKIDRVLDKKVTDVKDGLFDDVNKRDVKYVDMQDTEVTDVSVNRGGGARAENGLRRAAQTGLFSGFSPETLIYLPEGNDDGGEANVVIDGQCRDFQLYDGKGCMVTHDFQAAKASIDRTFVTSETSTVFLPFSIPAARAAALGNFHSFKEISGGNAVFNTKETGDIAANTPYIFLPATANISATNVPVVAMASGVTTKASGQLIGTYAPIKWTVDPGNIYGFAAEPIGTVVSGQFVRVVEGASIDPFRAYIKVDDPAPARLQLVIDDGTQTGISQLTDSRAEADSWYTVDGRRLSGRPAAKGVYIHKCKKEILR